MQTEQYQTYLHQIRYCKTLTDLKTIVQRFLEPTGFGDNQVTDLEDLQVSLDYYETAQCLKETDQAYFQKEIELLVFAHQQVSNIEAGQVSDEPEPTPLWQMFT